MIPSAGLAGGSTTFAVTDPGKGFVLALCPDRRPDILSHGPRSLVSGLLAALMTSAVIGVMSPP
ncbi:MAG: hypothetical protein ACR2OL_03865 [Anderseniella sp.]